MGFAISRIFVLLIFDFEAPKFVIFFEMFTGEYETEIWYNHLPGEFVLLRFFLFLILTWLTISITQSSSATEPYFCSAPNIHSIKTPLYNKSNSQLFSYKYQVLPQGDKDMTTVIYLQGGPGSGAIQDWSSPLSKELYDYLLRDSKLNWIFIDARGIGCNSAKNLGLPQDALTSELTAHDIINVIKSEGLKKYVLYGLS